MPLNYSITFLRCIRKVREPTDSIYNYIMPQTVLFLSKLTLKKLYVKCSIWPLCRGNGMLYYDERHSLLMKCFVTILRCISNGGRASGSITLSLIVHTMLFLSRSTLKSHAKIPDLGYSISTENGMLWCKARYPLLLKCSIIFLP